MPLPICLGTLRVAERKKRNRGRRGAQSGEECRVAARARSRKKWRRRTRTRKEEDESEEDEEQNEAQD